MLKERPFALHDYLCFAACMFSCGYFVVAIYGEMLTDSVSEVVSNAENAGAKPGGIGLHVTEIIETHPSGVRYTLLGLFINKPIWVTTTTLTKFSILHLQASIFNKKAYRKAAWVVAALCLMFWIAYLLEGFLLCQPIAFAWDKSISKGHCGSKYSDTFGPPIVNLVLDFIISVLPIPAIGALQLPAKKKAALSCILSIGFVICAMNIVRLSYGATLDLEDVTYTLLFIALFAGLEAFIGIIIACLPTLGPIIWRIRSDGSTDHNRWRANDYQLSLNRKEPRRYLRDLESLDNDNVPLTDFGMPQAGSTSVFAPSIPQRADLNRPLPSRNVIKVDTDLRVYDSSL
ncbi:MAG: hypothetical protein M1821_007624 [Bathelium mastoideum]|nr:MAG: hypothetical protein M1821_007624 [Bathelium mastoideum]